MVSTQQRIAIIFFVQSCWLWKSNLLLLKDRLGQVWRRDGVRDVCSSSPRQWVQPPSQSGSDTSWSHLSLPLHEADCACMYLNTCKTSGFYIFMKANKPRAKHTESENLPGRIYEETFFNSWEDGNFCLQVFDLKFSHEKMVHHTVYLWNKIL